MRKTALPLHDSKGSMQKKKKASGLDLGFTLE